MEEVKVADSIRGIAGAGIQISSKLIAFADQIGTAPQIIQNVGTDVSVTAGTLQELGELMGKDMDTMNSTGMFHNYQIQNIIAFSIRCREIFEELEDILGKANQQLRDMYKSNMESQAASSRIKLSKRECKKWPFLQPYMESLLSTLRDTKGTLILILQVIHLRHAHITASLDREEQKDLIRMIAAMRRQQLASAYGDGCDYKGLDARDIEESDSTDSSEVPMVLEAWSVTPNTSSDGAIQHFLITPIRIPQERIAKVLKTSPQEFDEITSLIDSLSLSERDAILGKVLGMRRSHHSDSTIRSIFSQSWTGSHDLFGKVTGRKFSLIIERRARTSKSSQINMEHKTSRSKHKRRYEIPQAHHYHSDSDPSLYDNFSDSDGMQKTEAHTHERRRPARAAPVPSFQRRRPFQGDDWEQNHVADEKRRKGQPRPRGANAEERTRYRHRWGNLNSQPWTESQAASEPSDEDLVKRLLTKYTNFELRDPLVQVSTKPPQTYDAIPKRVPRPY